MKFTLNNTAVLTRKPVFDMAGAEEGLSASWDRLTSAYESLVASESQVILAEQIMDDCQLAMDNIKKFGCTATVMSIFNGKDHDLDKALGMESLEVAALESMTAAQRALLKGKYVAALEAQEAGAVRQFVEKVKAWFAKFVQWIKEFFVGNAKLLKMVQECDFTKLDTNSTITAMPFSNAEKIAAEIEKISKNVQDVADGKEGASENAHFEPSQFDELLKTETKTMKELGWTAIGAQTLAGKFANFANNTAVKTAFNKLQKEYNEKLREITDNTVGDKLQAARMRFQAWVQLQKMYGCYNKLVRALGVTLLRMNKRQQKPAS